MASITNERLQELVEIYKGLKVRVLLIDEKYSLDFVEPKLDMPDSLNLTKLEYNPRSEAELKALAEQEVAAIVISKQASLDKSYNTKIKSLTNKIAKIELENIQKLKAMGEEYEKDKSAIHNRVVNNGLIFSTVKAKYEADLEAYYKTRISKREQDNKDEIALVKKEQDDAEAVYKEGCESLEQEKLARISQSYQKLLEAEEALKRSIEKYNIGLDEKEAKYQASRAKAYENARRAAYTRAYNNSKLYMEMGETAYRRHIQNEKYAVCKDIFYPLRRAEAQAILSMDSFLIVHLGIYYSAFEDWVNTTLLP